MLNYIWAFMILGGVLWGAVHGNLASVTDGAVNSAKDAVLLGITMLGIVSFWSGIMEIGKNAGLIERLSRKMGPVLRFLFPKIPEKHKSLDYIATNIIANILGLGWAATPAGLKAMEALKELEESRRQENARGKGQVQAVLEGVASNEMCTFLIINISSLQLIPVTMIAYRSEYGSQNPAGVVGPALAATLISTIAGVAACKAFDR